MRRLSASESTTAASGAVAPSPNDEMNAWSTRSGGGCQRGSGSLGSLCNGARVTTARGRGRDLDIPRRTSQGGTSSTRHRVETSWMPGRAPSSWHFNQLTRV